MRFLSLAVLGTLAALLPAATIANETSATILPGTCIPGKKGITVKANAGCCTNKDVKTFHLEAVTIAKDDVLSSIRADKNDPMTLCLPLSEDGLVRARLYLEPEQNRSYTGQTLVVGTMSGGRAYAYVKFRKGDKRGKPSNGQLLAVKAPISSFQFNGQALIKPTSAKQVAYGKQGDTVSLTFCADHCPE